MGLLIIFLKVYEDELKLFIEHINNKNIDYPNNLEKDFKVLKLLYTAEKSNMLGKKLDFNIK